MAFAVLRFGLKLEIGPEYDSNANRVETWRTPEVVSPDEPIASFLLRSTAAATLSWRAGPNTLRAGATLGGKLFFADEAKPQDVAVEQLVLDDSLRVGKRLVLGAGGDFYDATQWNACAPPSFGGGDLVLSPSVGDPSCHRDFRTGGGRAQAIVLLGPADLTLSAGGREFLWKPDDEFSFESGFAQLSAGLHLRSGDPDDESEWDLELSGRFEQRAFHGAALASATDDGSLTSARRADADTVASASITWVGPLLAGLAYALDWNRSTSYGQSYLRHLVTMKLAADLGWKVVATFKAQLTFTSYAQPTAVTTGALIPLTIDDENRDAIVFDLERPVGGGAAVSARYSVYRNGVSNATLDYFRQTVFLGLGYRLR